MSAQRGYDQALLDEAPVATRAQKQEGYNVDLLDDRPNRPLSTQPLSPPLPIDTDIEDNSQEKFPPGTFSYQKSSQSFWRTRKGIIIIFVIVILVGGVIGGAVGGTVGKNNVINVSSSNSTPGFGSSTSSSQNATDPGITSPTSSGTILQITASHVMPPQVPVATSSTFAGTSAVAMTNPSQGGS